MYQKKNEEKMKTKLMARPQRGWVFKNRRNDGVTK
jgi:hypothetical protein